MFSYCTVQGHHLRTEQCVKSKEIQAISVFIQQMNEPSHYKKGGNDSEKAKAISGTVRLLLKFKNVSL